ncbi:putative inactive receptor kinase [Abeliophyllum distichum]|uniref:Inactive receptor kinase n=1 Tax=Abeliophyllum distichum TaxID=126358 RepID=A0ABD1QJK1_9LAMI
MLPEIGQCPTHTGYPSVEWLDIGSTFPVARHFLSTIGKLDDLRVLSLRSNHLNGSLPSDILSIPSLQSIYLQHNNFSGDVPPSLSPRLSVVDLSFNSFTGVIPYTVKNLRRLSMLNLQFNSFSGGVPNLDLPRLKSLNLSHNLLNGAIVAIVIGGCSILLLLILVILFLCRKKKDSSISVTKAKASSGGKNENLKSEDFGSGVQGAEKNKLVFFEGCSYSFDLEDLLRASAEVLGKGSYCWKWVFGRCILGDALPIPYGTAYKAVLDEATVVVVKRLRKVEVAKKEFEQHMEIVDRIGRHTNIVPLRAYYYSKDEKLLVWEYMPVGSLTAALHGIRDTGRTPLDWDSRLKISLGAAKGLLISIVKKHPHWSPAAIKSALMTTSTTFDRAERPLQAQQYSESRTTSLVRATPFDFGSSHVDPRAALDPRLIFDAVLAGGRQRCRRLSPELEKVIAGGRGGLWRWKTRGKKIWLTRVILELN